MGKIFLQFSTEGDGIKIPVGVRPLIRKCCAAVLKKEGISSASSVTMDEFKGTEKEAFRE